MLGIRRTTRSWEPPWTFMSKLAALAFMMRMVIMQESFGTWTALGWTADGTQAEDCDVDIHRNEGRGDGQGDELLHSINNDSIDDSDNGGGADNLRQRAAWEREMTRHFMRNRVLYWL